MAGSLAERQLTGVRRRRYRFAMANRDDDAEIRRLLRDNPMPGVVALSFEREPDFFADACNPFESRQTIVACEDDHLVCMGHCTVRERFINGQAVRVGYLGGLRLAASHAGQSELVRAGYEFFHQNQIGAPADFYFTSIAATNARARRFLERGLSGMPSYEYLGELVTLLLPAGRAKTLPAGSEMPALAWELLPDRLTQFNRHYQLAPVWSAAELEMLSALGLKAQNFVGNEKASAILWDQSAFKQTVVRQYAPALARTRAFLNVAARLTGRMRLPAVGAPLRNAYVSHLMAEAGAGEALVELLENLRILAAGRGLELMTLAFADNDVRLPLVRRTFRASEYRTRIYLVHWPDCGGSARRLDQGVIAPEVALL